MSLKIDLVETRVVHVHASTQRELCEAFIRLQEFYESPLPEIRGSAGLTAEHIAARFKETTGADYYSTWHGFNLPGNVVDHFAAKYADDMSSTESWIVNAGLDAAHGSTHFYIIGTHDGYEAIDHELAHASYYLSETYRDMADVLYTSFATNHLLCGVLIHWLLDRGYAHEVIKDEVQAYMGTTDEAWWAEKFGPELAKEFWRLGAPFRELYKKRTAL